MTASNTTGISSPPSSHWIQSFLDDPFCMLLGPIYSIELTDPNEPLRLGMRIEQRHCNRLGICHGGTLMAFLDNSLGYIAANMTGAKGGGPTISMHVNFLKPAKQGDWIESRVSIDQTTGSMQFVRGSIVVGTEVIAQAAGVFVRPE